MKTKLITAVVAALFPFTVLAQEPSKASGPDQKIIGKLAEIVKVRKRIVEHYQALYGAGQASLDVVGEWRSAEVELIEARIDLAREQGGHDAVVNELKALVTACEQLVERAQKLHDAARGNSVEVERAQVALLKAQVRLLREQK